VWILQAGGLANAFGNGFVLPFLIIYLHNVRGISLAVAGLVAAANGAAALVSGPLAGTLSDRLGPRLTLMGALVGMAASFACFPLIGEAWHALALNALAGFFSGAFWPSQSSLLTGLAPPARRHAAFAQQRVTMNLGIGLGGLAGGLVATTSNPSTFTVLFLVDAATFLVFAAVLLRIPSPPREPAADGAERVGYARVLGNRAFRRFIALNTLVIAAGIVPLVEFLPVYAKNEAGVSERAIGVIFFLNTLVIVLAQVPIAKALEGRSRMRAFAAMGVLWALSWVVVAVAGTTLTALAATAVFALAVMVFAIGECLHGAVQGPLVADLAEPRLIGRYMAVSSLSWQFAFVVGPALGGAVLDAEPTALWLLAAAVCAAGGAASLALERSLPKGVRRTPRADVPGTIGVMATGMDEPLSTDAEPASHQALAPAARDGGRDAAGVAPRRARR
jgi:predicted MFS family arabinose efflux permease